MPKPSIWKNSGDTIKPIAGGITGFKPFPRVFIR